MTVDITSTFELLKKYDRSGPRYTSYPTAPEFKQEFTHVDYIEALRRASSFVDSPLSLYMHIPFCSHRCHFCGCTTVISRGEEPVERYLRAVEMEFSTVSKYLGKRRNLIQLHWGGGTPTHLTPGQI